MWGRGCESSHLHVCDHICVVILVSWERGCEAFYSGTVVPWLHFIFPTSILSLVIVLAICCVLFVTGLAGMLPNPTYRYFTLWHFQEWMLYFGLSNFSYHFWHMMPVFMHFFSELAKQRSESRQPVYEPKCACTSAITNTGRGVAPKSENIHRLWQLVEALISLTI